MKYTIIKTYGNDHDLAYAKNKSGLLEYYFDYGFEDDGIGKNSTASEIIRAIEKHDREVKKGICVYDVKSRDFREATKSEQREIELCATDYGWN